MDTVLAVQEDAFVVWIDKAEFGGFLGCGRLAEFAKFGIVLIRKKKDVDAVEVDERGVGSGGCSRKNVRSGEQRLESWVDFGGCFSEGIRGLEGTAKTPAVAFLVFFRPFNQEAARFGRDNSGILSANPQLLFQTGEGFRDGSKAYREREFLCRELAADSVSFRFEFARDFGESPRFELFEQYPEYPGRSS